MKADLAAALFQENKNRLTQTGLAVPAAVALEGVSLSSETVTDPFVTA
jgi:hypothetical protein